MRAEPLQILLSALPALALWWCLLGRRFPGERLIERERRRRARSRRQTAATVARPSHRGAERRRGGFGGVLAWDLGGRAPPR